MVPPHCFTATCFAVSSIRAIWVYISIALCKLMPLFALFLTVVYARKTITTILIDGWSHLFQMVRVETVSIPTQVVYL